MYYKKLTTLICLVIVASTAHFESRCSDLFFVAEGLHFRISDGTRATVISNPADESNYQLPLENGVAVIPSEVVFRGESVPVTGFEVKALQSNITRLELPASIETVSGIAGWPKLEYIDLGGCSEIGRESVRNLPALRHIMFRQEGDISSGLNSLSGLGIESWEAPARLHLKAGSLCDWSNLRYCNLSESSSSMYCIGNGLAALEELVLPKETRSTNILKCFLQTPSLTKLRLPESVPGGFRITECFTDCPLLQEIYSPLETPVDVINYSEDDFIPQPASEPGVILTPDRYRNIGGETVDLSACRVYVPVGCGDAYRNHPSWKCFRNIIETDFASVGIIPEEVSELPFRIEGRDVKVISGEDFAIYDTTGRSHGNTGLNPGIYFIRIGALTAKFAIR